MTTSEENPTKTAIAQAVLEANPEPQLQDLFAIFAVDKRKAREGVPFTVGGTTFQVARYGNPSHDAAMRAGMAKLALKYQEEGSTNTPKYDEEIEAMMSRNVVDHIIVGWDKLKLNGKVYEGKSEEACNMVATLGDLLEVILVFSQTRKNFAPVIEASDEKN